MESSKKNKAAFSAYEWAENILFSVAVVMLLFTFVVKTYIVDGSSMVPTLLSGDRVFAQSLFYTPAQGDVVIIDNNNSLREPLVKRVVATAGQTVDFDPATGVVLVDGAVFDAPIATTADNLRGDQVYPLTVPEGFIFVMGDNRGASLDSRYTELGFIDARSVLGKEFYALKTGR